MATTTPNYGWDVPTSTDYVKDGAVAIETLGDDIDATLYTVTNGKNVGLSFINETSFSAAASVSLPNDTFTSDFSNYRIMFELTAVSTTLGVNARFRASGVDDTTANYNYYIRNLNNSSGVETNTLARAVTVASVTQGSSIPGNFTIDIFNPKNAVYTTAYNYGTYTVSNISFGGFSFNTTDVFDSMTFIASTGNFTGKVRVYGYGE
jgi:hypothetical protein